MNKKVRFSRLPKIIKAEFLLPILATFLFVNTTVGGDTWFLLNSGRYIMNNGFPHTEVFTMHSGLNTIFQQWLTDVIFWNVYSRFGGIGMIVLLTVMFFIVAYLAYSICKKVSNNHFVSSIVSFVIMFFASASFLVFRPQTFTVCIMMAALLALESYMQSENVKYLIAIPILSVLEINFHASMWPVLFVLMLPFIVDCFKFDFKIIKCQGKKLLPMIITFVISFLCGFINPYGLDAVTYLKKSYGLEYVNSYVDEMNCLDVNTMFGIVCAGIFMLTFLVAFYKAVKEKNSVPVRYFLLVLGFGFMMFSSKRNIMFFMSLALFVLAYCFKDVDPTIKITQNDNIKSVKTIILIFGIIITFAITLVAMADMPKRIVKANGVSSNEGAVAYVLDNYNIKGKTMYTSYVDGSYCEYYGIKTYIDARAELFFKSNNGKEDIFNEYYEVQYGKRNYRKFLNKYNFDFLLLSKEDLLYMYINDESNYKLVYKDKDRVLYKNIDTVN